MIKHLSPALVLALAAQSSLSGQADRPRALSFTSTTTAILVDVVVRDRNGRPVVDLSAHDFEIAEDRVAQKIDTFTRVTRGGGIGVNVAWRSPDTTIAVSATSTSTPAPTPEPTDEDAHDGDRLRSPVVGIARRWRSARRSATSP